MLKLDEKGNTYVEGNDHFGLFMLLGGILIIGAIIAVATGQPAQQKAELAVPCSAYQEDTLNQIPVRCITPQGGFKQ